MKYLLDKDDAKETIDESLIEVKRVYKVSCDNCGAEHTLIEDSEGECKDTLIDELDWSVAEEIDEEGETVHTIVCDDCKMLVG